VGLGRTLVLGLIAGVTILLGLPIGRLRRPAPTVRGLLNAFAVGILVFLVWDVLAAAWEPIDGALTSVHDGKGGIGSALGYGVLFALGISVGLLGLVAYEKWMSGLAGRRAAVVDHAGQPRKFGPGAMAADELRPVAGIAGWSAGRRLALLIAVGIGLHNFAEGLAIGQSAASGEIALATLLVIGFALHNATEGFGIVAPMAADLDASGNRTRPGWGFLLTLGAIGGGPTFVGTLVGHGFTSEPVAVAFLTLAAGSILYVVCQLIGVAFRAGQRNLLMYGLLVGLLAGFLTDAIVSAGGA
jgi:ZIP family zinc transporter